MRRVTVSGYGGAELLALELSAEEKQPGPGQVLVEVVGSPDFFNIG